MAINFGQQINQALESSLNRVGDSKVRARQLTEQMRQRQFNQKMKRMVQSLREREFQLSQEAQTEKIMNEAMQRNLEREREERLQRLTDARINNLNDQGMGKGNDVNPSSLISGLQSLLNTSNRELQNAYEKRTQAEEAASPQLNAPSQIRRDNQDVLTAEERNDVDEGITDFTGSVNRSEIDRINQKLEKAIQDSAAAQEQLNPIVEEEEEAQENVQEIRNTLQSLIKSIRGESPGDNQEENQNSAPLDNL